MAFIEEMTVAQCIAQKHEMFRERDDWDTGARPETMYMTCFTCGVSWERHNGQWQLIDGGVSYDSW